MSELCEGYPDGPTEKLTDIKRKPKVLKERRIEDKADDSSVPKIQTSQSDFSCKKPW